MEKYTQIEWDTVVIGSGLAGLCAADSLCNAGLKTLLIDKGRGPGGRLGGRRFGGGSFDFGAQFFTARTAPFKTTVQQWIQAGVAEEWYRSYPGQPRGHPRYRGVPTMTAIAKYLSRGKTLLQSTQVERIARSPTGWRVFVDQNLTFDTKALLITCPVPQTLALLATSNITLSAEMQNRLQSVKYERCIAVMAILDSPSTIPSPGALSMDEGGIAWISDNQQKNVSTIPAVTIHASAEYSANNFDRNRQQVGQELIDLAKPLMGNAKIVDFQVHGWRYSKPITTDTSESILITQSTDLPPIAVAGDAFAGPRFEGAVMSGWSAAQELLTAINN
jgi:predicted NAD/FAD-dependent oxidoreductase